MTDQPGYRPGPAAPAPLSPSDERLWASLAHFGDILGFLPSLLILLLLKDRSEKVRVEAEEALNWIITVAIAYVVLGVLGGILGALAHLPAIGFLFGLLAALVGLLSGVLYIVNVVCSIIGGVRVNRGGSYRYPVNLRLVG